MKRNRSIIIISGLFLILLLFGCSDFMNEEPVVPENNDEDTRGTTGDINSLQVYYGSPDNNSDEGSLHLGNIAILLDDGFPCGLVLNNTGTEDILIDNMEISDTVNFYITSLTETVTINPGSTMDFKIIFIPQSTGMKTAVVTLTDINSNVFSFTVTGTGESPAVCGQMHSFVLKSNGYLYAFGQDSYGQLGDGYVGNPTVQPSPILVLTDVASVSCNYQNSMAIKKDGTLWSWGADSNGQLGDGTIGTPTYDPVPKMVLEDVIAVSCGYYHSAAIKKDGTLWTWGADSNGQLGDGIVSSPANDPVPKMVLEDIVSVKLQYNSGMALDNNGSLWTWGADSNGQLGDGIVSSPVNNPVPSVIMENVKKIEMGVTHCLALKTDNTLWTWGNNSVGQLGIGTYNSTVYPTPQLIMTYVADIDCNVYHNHALQIDGALWVWGYYNYYGGFGLGYSSQYEPSPKKLNLEFAAYGLSYMYSIGVKTDGSVWSWGYGIYGSLGTGNTATTYTPVKIMNIFE